MRVYISADPRQLAHCRYCHEPMYCIYDARLRDFCYACMVEAQQAAEEAARDIIREGAGGWTP